LGWWTVFGGGVLALWGHGYNAYGISVLFKPISEELGFSRAATSVVSSIGRFEGGIEALLTGWITDRWGARWLIITGVSIITIALLLMQFVHSLWAFYLIWGGLLSTGCNITLSLPMDVTISNWFVKKRAKALSIKWVFSGLSGVLVMPLIAWMTSTYDWRTACTVGGVVMGVVGLPIAWFLIKPRRPEYYGLLPDGAEVSKEVQASQEKMLERGAQYAAEVQEVEFTLRQAVKTRTFWLLTLTQAIPALVGPVMTIHCIPFLTDKTGMGLDPVKAAAIMAMMIFFGLPTRFIGGWIADRISIRHVRFIMTTSYFLQGFSVFLFLIHQTITMVYVWFILFGLGQGLNYAVGPFMRSRFFGRKAFGSIQGVASTIMTPIGVLAPFYAGWVYDTTGSYLQAFYQFAVLLGVAAVCTLFLVPPKPPAQISDVRSIV
jgi:sugar phosphate permease